MWWALEEWVLQRGLAKLRRDNAEEIRKVEVQKDARASGELDFRLHEAAESEGESLEYLSFRTDRYLLRQAELLGVSVPSLQNDGAGGWEKGSYSDKYLLKTEAPFGASPVDSRREEGAARGMDRNSERRSDSNNSRFDWADGCDYRSGVCTPTKVKTGSGPS